MSRNVRLSSHQWYGLAVCAVGAVAMLGVSVLMARAVQAADRAEAGVEVTAQVVEYQLRRVGKNDTGEPDGAEVSISYQVGGASYAQTFPVERDDAMGRRLESGSGPVGQRVTVRAEEADPLNFMVPGYPVGGLGWWLVVAMAAVGVVVGLIGVHAWRTWTRVPGRR
jgi:hypothetical protein